MDGRKVKLGIERLLEEPPRWLKGARIGLLANHASVDSRLNLTVDRIVETLPASLVAIFSPQHGFWSEKQANMKESKHLFDSRWGVPIYSLYSSVRKPSRDMLDPVEILLVDLQDVGTRVYTYATTMAYCMEACSSFGIKVVVADRPNPIGGLQVEGNLLKADLLSFVGPYSIPMRHGMTIGELAKLFNEHFGIGCDLEVVTMEGWKRNMWFDQTGLPWVPPSPNMPQLSTAWVYPGQVLLEGTNLSEGRGTAMPFHLLGAPYIDSRRLKGACLRKVLEGVWFGEMMFEPTYGKWKGKLCQGIQLHPYDRLLYRPYLTALMVIQEIMHTHPDQFRWIDPPYEYEYNRRPIDLLVGDAELIEGLEGGVDPRILEQSWMQELDTFLDLRSSFLLYE